MYRVLTVILAILTSNIAFALDNEYKNSLSGLDLSKTSESSYNINLYTSKEFSQPVKVIKKSDLSYYILLPETNNTAQNLSINNNDIRSIETQLFPYAGSDVQNGYTKININTTKPIRFNVNARVASSAAQQKTIVKENETKEIKTAVEDTKVQKKNLVQESQESKSNYIENKKLVPSKRQVEPSNKKVYPTAMAAAKLPVPKQEAINNELQEQNTDVATEDQQTDVKKDIENVEKEPISEIINDNAAEEVKQKTNIVNKEKILLGLTSLKSKFIQLSHIFKNKLNEYGLNIKELILMLTAGFLSFIVMLLFLTRNKDVDTRLKSKSAFVDKNAKQIPSLVAKKPQKNAEGQYFVFDKGVKQTGFIAPSTGEKRNYELSSYEPSIASRTSVAVEPYYGKQAKNEYDIIQNILREDSYIDYNVNEPVLSKEYSEPSLSPVVSAVTQKQQEAIHKPAKIEKDEVKDEAEVLSSVEIAPQRGFMCVSYNNSISLVGYIFDDVFALYNFQQPKLENYNIKFRLSEKTKFGANFIVRVDKSKMLVNVTKSSMNLELAM